MLKPYIRDVLICAVIVFDLTAVAVMLVDFDNWPQALVLVGIALTLAVVERGA